VAPTSAFGFDTLSPLAAHLVGSAMHRPYVFGFLAIFLVAGARDLGWLRTLAFLLWGGLVALAAELASTRVGLPFGFYHYTGDTQSAELFISNVPFFSPLSFPFLAYAAFCLARRTLGPTWAASRRGRLRVVAVASVLMMLLDVVIDPLAVRGGRWFLGHIFYYPDGGLYFGVPLSNFLGWLVVGWITIGGAVLATGLARGRAPGLGIGLYYLVLMVNLTVTLWIGEVRIALAGIVIHVAVFLLLYNVNRMTVGRWSAERLSTPAISGGGGSEP
jgi:uncharacterized membrane protein